MSPFLRACLSANLKPQMPNKPKMTVWTISPRMSNQTAASGAPARLILLNASMPNVMGINAEKKRSSLGIAFTGKLIPLKYSIGAWRKFASRFADRVRTKKLVKKMPTE